MLHIYVTSWIIDIHLGCLYEADVFAVQGSQEIFWRELIKIEQ